MISRRAASAPNANVPKKLNAKTALRTTALMPCIALIADTASVAARPGITEQW
jgi:hypothetical protein